MQHVPLYAALFSVLFGLIGSLILARGAALASPEMQSFNSRIQAERVSRRWLIQGFAILSISCVLAAIAVVGGFF